MGRMIAVGAVAGACLDAAPALADEPDEPSEPIEVVSLGTPVDERDDPTPAVYVLRGEELAGAGTVTADVLARVPGLEVTRTGGAADLATVSVRGATSAQTPIYLSGVRLNDELTGTVDLSTLPLWLLHRVEVYRGHAPLDADELGIGGAIFLEPSLPRRPRAFGALGFGSLATREARAGVGLGNDDAGAVFSIRQRSSEGDFAYLDDNGTRFDESDDVERERRNADHDELDVWAIGRVSPRLGAGAAEGPNRAQLTSFVNIFRRDAGAPGLSLLGAESARSEQRRIIAGVAVEVPCADDCTLDVNASALLSRYQLSDPARELGAAQIANTDGERFSERLRVRTAASEHVTLSFGAAMAHQQLRLGIDRSPIQRARRRLLRFEAGVMVEPIDSLALVVGGAMECHSTAARGLGEDGRDTCGVLAPVGRSGMRWRPSPALSLFANGGRYVRVPTLGELYGQSAVVRGNDALVEEGGWSADAGAAFAAASGPIEAWLQLVGFLRYADDLIGYRRSSLGTVRPYNVASARVLGVEVASGATLWRIVDLGANITGLDPRDTSDGRTVQNDLLPLHSRIIVAGRVGLVSPPWKGAMLDEARITARALYRASRVADPAGLITLEAQRQFDLEASLQFAERFALRMRLSNLLDLQQFDQVGYPLPGRAIYGELEAWF